jgi:hypothetical protein
MNHSTEHHQRINESANSDLAMIQDLLNAGVSMSDIALKGLIEIERMVMSPSDGFAGALI